jgi:hypothetical protein
MEAEYCINCKFRIVDFVLSTWPADVPVSFVLVMCFSRAPLLYASGSDMQNFYILGFGGGVGWGGGSTVFLSWIKSRKGLLNLVVPHSEFIY